MKIRRIAAYGLCRDAEGRVLLTRYSDAADFPGLWALPGGGVEQGEDPEDAVVREVAEETGLSVRITGLRSVTADVVRLPGSGALEHTDRIVYQVVVTGGDLCAEVDGTSDEADWAVPDDRPLMPFTARLLGRPVPRRPGLDWTASGTGPADTPVSVSGAVQRFGAYAVATDPAGRILLTRIASGYPGAGRWHLPGGGTDHGEAPEDALARELREETSQCGRIVGLLGTSHRYDPTTIGPEGVPIDWHVVRVLFRVRVEAPTDPVVTEAAGGSTAAAGWFAPSEVADLPLTEITRAAVRRLTRETVS